MAIRGRFGSQPGRVERMPRPASRIWFATNSGFMASWYDRVAMQRQTTVPYKTDFALWLTTQAAALREGRFGDLDAANIAEELDSLGNSDRREIRSRLKQVAAQLLKYQYQPERATSWRSTIVVQVSDIEDVFEDSPSLRRELPAFIAKAYPRARKLASDETGLPIETFPEQPTAEFERAIEAALRGADFTT